MTTAAIPGQQHQHQQQNWTGAHHYQAWSSVCGVGLVAACLTSIIIGWVTAEPIDPIWMVVPVVAGAVLAGLGIARRR